jgi:hypothetical protein
MIQQVLPFISEVLGNVSGGGLPRDRFIFGIMSFCNVLNKSI